MQSIETMTMASDECAPQDWLVDDVQDRLPLERIRCPDLRAIGEAWIRMERQAGEALPRWGCFRAADFIRVLPKICVLHAPDAGCDDLEFGLYGAHPTHVIGLGRKLVMQKIRHDPNMWSNYIDIRDRARRAIVNQTPQYALKNLAWRGRPDVEYEILMLPFQPEIGRTQRLLQPVSATTPQSEIDTSFIGLAI